MDNSPHRQLAPWTTCPMDNLPQGQLAPWTTHPMDNSPHDNSPHRQLAPRTTRPMTTRPITYDKKLRVYYFINTFHWLTLHKLSTFGMLVKPWTTRPMDNLPHNSSPHKYIFEKLGTKTKNTLDRSSKSISIWTFLCSLAIFLFSCTDKKFWEGG